MKSVVLYFLLALVFISCNIKNEEAVEATVVAVPEGSLTTDTGTIPEPDSLSSRLNKKAKLLLIARGSEPGWYAEFFEDHLRLLIDNGTDSLLIEENFSEINKDEKFHSKLLWGHEKSTVEIEIENKTCTEEASGEKREKSIIIKYNGKTYKGCATAKIN